MFNPNRVWLPLSLLVFCSPMAGWGQDSETVSQRIEVFLDATKIIQVDRPVEEVTSSDSRVLTAAKVPGSEMQISLTGVSLGGAQVTVRTVDKSYLYEVHVSPKPERLYINIPESKRLSFASNVDDFTLSVPNIVRIQQPNDKVLLAEALRAGKTTLTVTSNGEIYRYFISTFDNRGADLLEIQNAFASKGYRFLQVAFDNDKAVLSGTVPTQEELDDAVRIIKQYTPFVEVKAVVGALGVDYAESEEERVIVNNIKRIANIPGLIVKVKFQQPQEIVTSQFSRVAGNPVLSTSVTDNQTRLTTDSLQLPPTDAGAPGGTERPVQEGTIERINRTHDLSVPEKIFLFGEVRDDLEEARAIRVARTFCPLIVSFLTVKDPIQLRFKVRFALVELNKIKETGVLWTGPDGGEPFVAGRIRYELGYQQGNLQDPSFLPPIPFIGNTFDQVLTNLLSGFTIDAQAQLRLLEEDNLARLIQESEILVTNGQVGQLFVGQQIPYVSASTVTEFGTTFSVEFFNVGVSTFIVPLRYERSSQFNGEQLSIQLRDGEDRIPNLASFMQLENPIGNQPLPPYIDQSTKYVDENGLIGVDVTTQVSALIDNVQFGSEAVGVFTAPQTSDRFTSNRAHLRDGHSIVVSGLFDDEFRKLVRRVPFLSELPIFGWLFRNPNDDFRSSELFIIYTPEIVRSESPYRRAIPEPNMPEMKDVLKDRGLVPQLTPILYDAGGADLRADVMPAPTLIKPQRIADDKTMAAAPTRDTKNFRRTSSSGTPTTVQPSIVRDQEPAASPGVTGGSLFTTPASGSLGPRPASTDAAVDTAPAKRNTPYTQPDELPATLP